MNLIQAVAKNEQYQSMIEALQKENARVAVFGMHAIHRALYAAVLAKNDHKKIIFICETDADAVTAAQDIGQFGVCSAAYTTRDYVFIEAEGISHDIELSRLSVLGRAITGDLDIICCSLEAYCQLTMPKETYEKLSKPLKLRDHISIRELSQHLVWAGYTRADRVEGPGQFSVRGGIVDIFAVHHENPVRIEFFGDEIDGMAEFDAVTQRREINIKETIITPAREVVLGEEAAERLTDFSKKCEKKAPELALLARRDAERLIDGITPPVTDRYLNVVYEMPGTLLDYLPDAVLFQNEPANLQQRHKNLLFRHTEELLSLEKQGLYLKNSGGYYKEEIEAPGHKTILSEVFTRTIDGKLDAVINVRANIIPRWNGEMDILVEDLLGYTSTGYACIVLAGTPRAAAALSDDLNAANISATVVSDTMPNPGTVGITVGHLSTGFELSSSKLCLITGRRDNKPDRRRKKTKKKEGRAISSLEELRAGDLVVHQNHGIGMYDGIHRIDHHGLVRDYIKIQYRGADTLYVPVTQLDMVSQYISPKGDDSVKLAKLHSGEWNKTKQNVYRSVREMAKELIELYAKREKAEGIAFSPDTDWQHDFEARFAYDETDDQLRATAEIKKDMEQPHPMDRLLCGDVGVGKTEVALRAIFKCVNDGYQCAVLVPTTILAWQHFHTFKERLEAYPIKVAMLSRFSTAKETREALAGIKNGTVDVVVGTHRLLQKDVQFKRLGLLVVDEEQRFGVSHKEKLKQAFEGVDVLTLSATPIPRTLNMALSGIRDMSTIEEPPQDRHPVQTFVVEYDESLILDAIKRELARGGQVYYLHNRVESIEGVAYRLSQQLPDAAIDIAHGQMDEAALSEVWRRLIAGECDILVCTTIIETGVDVPNVNTLVVEDADRMGLAQLYQIRGRVGRSGRRAYAYFTFRRDKVLTDVAAKRLSAIRDFTSFGSGFKIAMRDLQIRGAGSVLSARQSGHMAAVGYDTYLRILEQAVDDEAGKITTYKEPIECTVDMAVSAYIPESYIQDNESRIEIYKRIAGILDASDADDVRDELQDRFGDIPHSVETLVSVSLIRALGGPLGFYEVKTENGGAWVMLYSDSIDTGAAQHYVRQKTRKVLVSVKGKSHMMAEVKPGEEATDVALEALTSYQQGLAQKQIREKEEKARTNTSEEQV